MTGIRRTIVRALDAAVGRDPCAAGPSARAAYTPTSTRRSPAPAGEDRPPTGRTHRHTLGSSPPRSHRRSPDTRRCQRTAGTAGGRCGTAKPPCHRFWQAQERHLGSVIGRGETVTPDGQPTACHSSQRRQGWPPDRAGRSVRFLLTFLRSRAAVRFSSTSDAKNDRVFCPVARSRGRRMATVVGRGSAAGVGRLRVGNGVARGRRAHARDARPPSMPPRPPTLTRPSRGRGRIAAGSVGSGTSA